MLMNVKVAAHYATDWSEYPALRKLGCKDPEPIVDPHPPLDPEADPQLLIQCSITGLCFTIAESRGEHWIPGPDELAERRNAIRDGWDEAELASRDVTQGATIKDRSDARAGIIPTISTQGWGSERKKIGGD